MFKCPQVWTAILALDTYEQISRQSKEIMNFRICKIDFWTRNQGAGATLIAVLLLLQKALH